MGATFSAAVAAETTFVAEYLEMGASAEQVAKLINLDVRTAYETEGADVAREAVFTGWARIEALRVATGHRASLPAAICKAVS